MNPSTNDPLGWIDRELERLDRQGLLRRLRTRVGRQAAVVDVDGRELVNFGSNDYLGLAGDPRLAAAAAEAADSEGWGSGASPLILGHGQAHERLEAALARFEGTEAALLFASGFAANAGTIAALVGPGDVVFSDRKNHASLLDGCRLCRADVRVYPHGDWQRLDRLLDRSGDGNARGEDFRSAEGDSPIFPAGKSGQSLGDSCRGRRLIVTDSLFSMDGDLAPLTQLADVAGRHGAMLLVDEAHATGVFGSRGRGVAEHLGVEDRVDVRVGTLSKALGSVGGFVAGPRKLIDWLVNRARPYVFSTATPAATAAAGWAALEIVQAEPYRREELLARAEGLRAELSGQGWDVGRSASQIVPVVVGEPDRAVALGAALAERGLFVPAVRPPTVPDGESCLRISISFLHTPEMLARLVDSLAALR